MAFVQDILPFQPPLNILSGRDVSSSFHAITKVEHGSCFFSHCAFNFFSGPHVKHAFPVLSLALFERAVRVQCGIEGTFGALHLTQCKVQSVAGDAGIERVIGCLVGFGVQCRELGLVVEHLLEVWYTPATVSGISMETAANLVMNSTSGHGAQILQYHVERVFLSGSRPVPQQEVGDNRPWEPGDLPETAIRRVVRLTDLLVGLVEQARLQRTAPTHSAVDHLLYFCVMLSAERMISSRCLLHASAIRGSR